MNLNTIAVIILTYNEEKHIARCIESVSPFATEILIVDSHSNDSTLDIAKSFGVRIYQNKFINQAMQINWALENCPIDCQWIMRIDADEVATPELVESVKNNLFNLSDDFSGVTINRRIYFLGKWIRRGGIYPIAVLRIWRNGCGKCEERWMDEHIVVEGKVHHLEGDISDINLNNITWWTEKHNNYSGREAIELLLNEKQKKQSLVSKLPSSKEARSKRWIKDRIYSKLPIWLRSFSYFFYRYLIRFGFLDGWQGLAFHLLQGLWYRFLVDIKVYEIKVLMNERRHSLKEVVKAEYSYDLDS